MGETAIVITDGGNESKVCKQFARWDNNLAEVADSILAGSWWDMNLETS